MGSQIIVVASLFIHSGREFEFRQFETEAASIMHKYGGRIAQVIHPTSSLTSEALPYEIHIVMFPSLERFEAYRNDADLAKLTSLREAAIARTSIIIGEEGEPYL